MPDSRRVVIECIESHVAVVVGGVIPHLVMYK